ncbi:MAG TPA: SagB/ThcOx family dehydrogenase [Candidatus Cloacimonetes bacterium]|nr:SagB/ThcOx family dehydrogenase [Candidatus Cloacimonadota bacterium]
MTIRTFDYLYYKTRGYSDVEISELTGATLEDIADMEISCIPALKEIEARKPKARHIGEDFVFLTRYVYAGKSDQQLGKTRPDAIKARSGDLQPLPAVGTLKFDKKSLQKVVGERRSLRKYSSEKLSMEELSFLLWCTSWSRDYRSNERSEFTFRNVPSAGSRHPLETYLEIRMVEGLKPGLYYYHPIKHCLILIEEGAEIHQKIYEGCLRQEMIANSAVNFIFSAVPYRTSWRYGQRGYRYLYLDAGHVGQNLHLAAENIDAGACMIGAFLDEAMNETLGFDGKEEFVIYVAAVGKKEA